MTTDKIKQGDLVRFLDEDRGVFINGRVEMLTGGGLYAYVKDRAPRMVRGKVTHHEVRCDLLEKVESER